MMNHVFVKALRPGAILPARSTDGSAGYDLTACLEEDVTLAPGAIVSIPTGVAIAIESPDYAAFLFGRSGLGAKHGIVPANAVGVIDSDYRGELIVALKNAGPGAYTIHPGDRIAQMLFLPVATPLLEWTDTLDETDRGTEGFGSTGR